MFGGRIVAEAAAGASSWARCLTGAFGAYPRATDLFSGAEDCLRLGEFPAAFQVEFSRGKNRNGFNRDDLAGDPEVGDSLCDEMAALENGELTAEGLMQRYCGLVYDQCQNYEEVARRLKVDRRTVRKYVLDGRS